MNIFHKKERGGICSLSKSLIKLNKNDIIIIDEAQRLTKVNWEAIEKTQNLKQYGVILFYDYNQSFKKDEIGNNGEINELTSDFQKNQLKKFLRSNDRI